VDRPFRVESPKALWATIGLLEGESDK